MSCCTHIKDNIEKRFGAEAAKSFFLAAQEPAKEGFYSNIGALLSRCFQRNLFQIYLSCFFSHTKHRNKDAFNYISQIDPHQYAKCYATSTLGRSTSQLIESLWASLVKARAQPLVSFYLAAIAKFAKWADKHRYLWILLAIFQVFSNFNAFLYYKVHVHATSSFGKTLWK